MYVVHKWIIMFVSGVIMLGGCASQQAVRERYFWPAQPETPRIEWLGTFQNETNLKALGSSSNAIVKALIGETGGESLADPMFITSNGAGKVYVSDQMQAAVFIFDFNTLEVTPLGKGKMPENFVRPSGIALDGEGNVYAADLKSKKIYVFDKNDEHKTVLNIADKVEAIGSIAIDKQRKRIIVPDLKGHKIVALDFNGAVIWSVGKRGVAGDEFNFPTSAAVDREGNIIICDSMNARIVKLTSEGKPLSQFGKRGDGPGDFAIIKAAAVDSQGNIYVTDGRANRVNIFNDKGEVLLTFGGYYKLMDGMVNPGGFNIPQGIYIDQHDTIYVVDQLNFRFQKFQLVTEQYLRQHPITEAAPQAKPPKGPARSGE